MYAGMAVMLVWWSLSTTTWALVVFALLFGTGYGGYVALFPAISADYFSGRHSTSIFGFLLTNLALGTLIGPAFAGIVFDVTRSYVLPIVTSAALNVAAVGCMLAVAEPAAWRRAWAAGTPRVAGARGAPEAERRS
ncbi:MAG TPA: MFS transporter, partial [Methylomirabilota bacterium]|nr:MFS transporter [Methylomirabilota bacterium]